MNHLALLLPHVAHFGPLGAPINNILVGILLSSGQDQVLPLLPQRHEHNSLLLICPFLTAPNKLPISTITAPSQILRRRFLLLLKKLHRVFGHLGKASPIRMLCLLNRCYGGGLWRRDRQLLEIVGCYPTIPPRLVLIGIVGIIGICVNGAARGERGPCLLWCLLYFLAGKEHLFGLDVLDGAPQDGEYWGRGGLMKLLQLVLGFSIVDMLG